MHISLQDFSTSVLYVFNRCINCDLTTVFTQINANAKGSRAAILPYKLLVPCRTRPVAAANTCFV